MNQCEGIVPIQWVEACITAIHIKGRKSEIDNKMMESIILLITLFNEQKCKCMHIGNDKTSRSYQMNDHILENVKEIKDFRCYNRPQM